MVQVEFRSLNIWGQITCTAIKVIPLKNRSKGHSTFCQIWKWEIETGNSVQIKTGLKLCNICFGSSTGPCAAHKSCFDKFRYSRGSHFNRHQNNCTAADEKLSLLYGIVQQIVFVRVNYWIIYFWLSHSHFVRLRNKMN